MDVITLAMAKAYTDKKAIGGEESHVFKWDARNGTDGLTTNTAGTYAKISNLTPTAAELEGGILDIAGLIQIDLSVSGGTIAQSGNAFALGQYLVIATVAEGEYPESGIYINVGLALEVYGQENPFVTLQWETIHPIDPKYLPGVCLPVVELETAVTSTQAALSEEDGAQMDALNGEPAVLKLVAIVNGAEWALRGIAACTNVNGILVYSIISYVESKLLVFLMNAGNGWVAVCNYG